MTLVSRSTAGWMGSDPARHQPAGPHDRFGGSALRSFPGCGAETALAGRATHRRPAESLRVLGRSNAATRRSAGWSERIGHDLGPGESMAGFFQRRFVLLPDREDLVARWHALVRANKITGYRSHDARLAAAMDVYGIGRLLTFNADDFRPFAIT